MGLGDIGLVVIGAFAGGFVSGLTGFGTGIGLAAFVAVATGYAGLGGRKEAINCDISGR